MSEPKSRDLDPEMLKNLDLLLDMDVIEEDPQTWDVVDALEESNGELAMPSEEDAP